MSVAANSLVTAVGTAVSALLSVVLLSLGARWLGPAEYGDVGAVLAIANVFFLLLYPVEASFTLNFARLVGQDRLIALASAVRRSFHFVLVVAMTLLLSWLALTSALAQIPRAGALQWLGVFCCSALATCVPRAALRGRELFRPLAVNFVLESGGRLLAGLFLIHFDRHASSMLAGYGIGSVLALLHSASRMSMNLPHVVQRDPGHEENEASPRWSSSVPLFVVHAYTALMLNLDVLAANRYLPPVEAGLYAGASSITRIVAVTASPLSLVLFSRLASLDAAGRNTRQTIWMGASVLLAGALASLLIPGLFGTQVLRAFLGEEFAPAQKVLLYQWGTACVLVAQGFAADALIATSGVRGAWLLLAPALALPLALSVFHASAQTIAQVTLLISTAMGSAVLVVLWYRRAPALLAALPPER